MADCSTLRMLVAVGVLFAWSQRPARAEPADRSSATLERAIELYRRDLLYQAHVELYKVTSGQTADSSQRRHQAELLLGATLFRMGYHSAAAVVLEGVQQKGGRMAIAAVEWQVSMPWRLRPMLAPVLALLPMTTLDDPALAGYRDRIRVVRGAHALEQGDQAGAAAAVVGIGVTSASGGTAQFILGLSHANRGMRAEALAEFARIARKADESGRALLGAAQEHLRAGDWQAAIESLRYVGNMELGTREDGRRAAFAASWARLEMRGVAPRALAPYAWGPLVVASGPEPDLLRAVIAFDLCRGRRKVIADALARLRKHRQLDAELAALGVEHVGDDARFLTDRVQHLVRGRGTGLSARALSLARTYLDGEPVFGRIALVDAIEHELASFNAASLAWKGTAAATALRAELTSLHAWAQADAGRVSRARLQLLAADVAALRGAAAGLPAIRASRRPGNGLTVLCE